MPLDFTAIDFETANSSSASACSVGLVRVRDGEVVASDGWLIRPPSGHDRFFDINVSIHGITADAVESAPGWVAQLPRLLDFIGDDVLVAHNAGFDMAVLRRACEATDAALPALRSVCSVDAARRAGAHDLVELAMLLGVRVPEHAPIGASLLSPA
ncbi:MAG: polymerase subunit epsilon [Microbacterium sp.]|nr:polymerase subunit epsilon [Microbacterium sp.]